MVRVALQLSGRLKFTDDSLMSLQAAIVSPLKPDIFCSFWYPERAETVVRYRDALHPLLMEFEDQGKQSVLWDQLFMLGYYPNMASMCYKFYRAAQLRRSHEIAHGFRYDVVIQARSDNIFMEPLDRERCQQSIDQNVILCNNQVANENIDPYLDCAKMVDNFYFGPSILIDKAADTFWHMKRTTYEQIARLNFHNVAIPEILLSKVWHDLGVPIGTLTGRGEHGNFNYDIDRRDTEWR